MKAFWKHVTMAGVIAGASFAAIAQTSDASPPPPPPTAPAQMRDQSGPHDAAQWRAKMAERHAQRMEKLKAELAITPQQESAWNAFADALQPPAPPAQASPKQMREQFAQLTTPERIDRMRALRDRRAALMDQRDIATKTFYAALSPEQQKKFDDVTLRMMHRHGEHGWHHGPKG